MTLAKLFVLTVLCIFIQDVFCLSKGSCIFPKHVDSGTKNGENQIEVLRGHIFDVEDEDYKYKVGICTDAMDPVDPDITKILTGAGVIQFDKGDPAKVPVIIGMITEADIVAGPEWVQLEYKGGDKYGSHCNQEPRTARIMFICDMTAPEETVNILEEQNNKTDACYYQFEINTAAVCPKQPYVTVGLSVGSVLLIVFSSLVLVYLVGGCLYNRLVLGAKGLDQLPNRSFWQDFGNLQADGCDFICRSKRSGGPKSYKGIGDDQLTEERHADDNLLPM